MAAGLWGTIICELVYADAGYVNYGEPVRCAAEEDAKGLLKKSRLVGLFWN